MKSAARLLSLALAIGCGCSSPPRGKSDATPGPSSNAAVLPALISGSQTNSASLDQPKPQPKRDKPASNKVADKDQKPSATPDNALAGKVLVYHSAGRFVVMNFPPGHLPGFDQRLGVYRAGLKVGEVKISGPQRDDNIVGDVTEGEAQPGDDVRDR